MKFLAKMKEKQMQRKLGGIFVRFTMRRRTGNAERMGS